MDSDLSDFYEHFTSHRVVEELPWGDSNQGSNEAWPLATYDIDWDSLYASNATSIPRPISPYSADSIYSVLTASPTTTVCDLDSLLGDVGEDLGWLEAFAKAPPLPNFTLQQQTAPLESGLQLERTEPVVAESPGVETPQKKRKRSLELEADNNAAEEAARQPKKAKWTGEKEVLGSGSSTVVELVVPSPSTSSSGTAEPTMEPSNQSQTARISDILPASTSAATPKRTQKNKRSLTREQYDKISRRMRDTIPPYTCPECKNHGAAHQRSKMWKTHARFITHLKTHMFEEERAPSDWFTCIGLSWQEAKLRGLPVNTTDLITEVTGEKRYFGCGKQYTKKESLTRHLNAAWCLKALK